MANKKTPGKKKTPGNKKLSNKKMPDKQSDDKLWQYVTADVEPLADRPPAPEDFMGMISQEDTTAARHAAMRAARPRRAPHAQQSGAATADAPASKTALPQLNHDKQPGMDKASAVRMRRGKTTIEGTLDLHGMTQAMAHRALARFIDQGAASGLRTVLVITGKGRIGDGGTHGRIGVLREAVPRWLNEAPTRELIIGFSHAAPKDGGTGALYIRLKRKREGALR